MLSTLFPLFFSCPSAQGLSIRAAFSAAAISAAMSISLYS
jgi:hypothetical protein